MQQKLSLNLIFTTMSCIICSTKRRKEEGIRCTSFVIYRSYYNSTVFMYMDSVTNSSGLTYTELEAIIPTLEISCCRTYFNYGVIFSEGVSDMFIFSLAFQALLSFWILTFARNGEQKLYTTCILMNRHTIKQHSFI